MGEAILGVVANPMSGRDIRRLVARASVFPTAEKAAMVTRLLSAAAAVGVERVLLSTDVGGVSAAVLRAVRTQRACNADGEPRWPRVEFVDLPAHTQTALDTVELVHRMIEAGAGVIACLGGDGTARAAAGACGDVPLLPLSTGTNNVFPRMHEATVAGLAAGLVVTGAVSVQAGTRRASTLLVRVGDRTENALVDVAVTQVRDVGARAMWDPAVLAELYCTFAEPDAIGLSSIAGQVCPSARDEPSGVAMALCPPSSPDAALVVRAPIAPGLVLPVGVRSWRRLEVGEQVAIAAAAGTVAVDGEREVELGSGTRLRSPPTVRLSPHGPRIVDIPAVLGLAARDGLLRTNRDRES